MATLELESTKIKGNFNFKSGPVKVTRFGSKDSNIKVPTLNNIKRVN